MIILRQPRQMIGIMISQLGLPVLLGNEFYYQHLPLCVIDAVFSIGIRYSTVQRVVQNFCCYTGWSCFRNPIPSPIPPIRQQRSINDLLKLYHQMNLNFGNIAISVFGNSNRTAPKGGILKSEAVYRFAKILNQNNTNYFQNLNININRLNAIKTQIAQIPGLRSGIAFDYFLMLAGDSNGVKPDRMVKRYLSWLFCTKINTNTQAIRLLNTLHKILLRVIPNLTLRQLDYAIWNFQRNIINFGCKKNYITAHLHKRGNLITVQPSTSNQQQFEACLRQVINYLQVNNWIINRRIRYLVFRICPNGQLKIPEDIIKEIELQGITVILLNSKPFNGNVHSSIEKLQALNPKKDGYVRKRQIRS